jgi:hypothetical protein
MRMESGHQDRAFRDRDGDDVEEHDLCGDPAANLCGWSLGPPERIEPEKYVDEQAHDLRREKRMHPRVAGQGGDEEKRVIDVRHDFHPLSAENGRFSDPPKPSQKEKRETHKDTGDMDQFKECVLHGAVIRRTANAQGPEYERTALPPTPSLIR